MTRLRAGLLALCLGVSTLAAGGVARADGAADVAAARDLFNEASRFAAAGKWDEARDRYQRSLALKRAAITIYSLGVAQRNTGKLVEAIENFRAFLNEPPTPATLPYVAAARQAITEIAPRLAKIAITIEPPDAPELLVTVDGERVPNLALDRARVVNPGAHDVKARAKGYAESSQHVEVHDGESGAAKLTLVPGKEAPAPVATVAPAPLAPRVAAAPDNSPPPSRALPIVLMTVGGALCIGGVTVGLLGVAQAASAPTRNGPEASAARAKSAAGDAMTGVGLGAAVVGLVILVTQHRPPRTDAAIATPRD